MLLYPENSKSKLRYFLLILLPKFMYMYVHILSTFHQPLSSLYFFVLFVENIEKRSRYTIYEREATPLMESIFISQINFLSHWFIIRVLSIFQWKDTRRFAGGEHAQGVPGVFQSFWGTTFFKALHLHNMCKNIVICISKASHLYHFINCDFHLKYGFLDGYHFQKHLLVFIWSFFTWVKLSMIASYFS